MIRFPAILSFAILMASCGDGSQLSDDYAEQEDAALKERIATVINLNGNLCAEVVWVGPVISSGEYAGEYQVNCEEFRDASKSDHENNMVVYMVNPDTKNVRLMGGG